MKSTTVAESTLTYSVRRQRPRENSKDCQCGRRPSCNVLHVVSLLRLSRPVNGPCLFPPQIKRTDWRIPSRELLKHPLVHASHLGSSPLWTQRPWTKIGGNRALPASVNTGEPALTLTAAAHGSATPAQVPRQIHLLSRSANAGTAGCGREPQSEKEPSRLPGLQL